MTRKHDRIIVNRIISARQLKEILSISDEYGITLCGIDNILRRNGVKGLRIYNIHRSMIKRCYQSSCSSYSYYGGRGILICDTWINDCYEFAKWSCDNGYKDNLSIDRIDNNWNYCPENCRWVDNITQQNNKRNNTFITAFNETKTVSEWSRDDRCSVSKDTILQRLVAKTLVNWSIEEIISIPVKHRTITNR